ncbi:magnesium transporter CorA family protein [Pediococcus acidilactici]|uniref:magnesium transporter CorA family protein n=1 Tax=Pediococcus acidilactici TaxID=1254 RepID=UPI0013641C37|nr:magnesium transporter CorA family protein [Pediococcus acidilactici]NBI15700.1 magnesium transporter CorA family protein [Pediococcus acidilactici]NFA46189.1 magnesium transporter CorA family protein [Pediococcus acidilactici]NFA47657.1 magnesium transporter CorA family protein [Pediococcus acidilactici]NFA88934.1 magnesium transporter CorA family protein [Pediococcus acidilactici]NFB09757.1 magnesium transporter CorA family protein [Pediococcus acidilactici]
MPNHHVQLKIETFTSVDSLNNLIQKHQWPATITAGLQTPEVFPRTMRFKHGEDEIAYLIAVCNLAPTDNILDSQVLLEPLIIVSEPEQLTFLVHEESASATEIQQLYETTLFNSNEGLIACFLLKIYSNYRVKLAHIKEQLEEIEAQSTETTKNEYLIEIKNIKKEAVILEHTLDTQHQALERLFKLAEFTDNLADEAMIYNIKTAERQITKLIAIYRDLIEAISGLFTDIMSNHLNHLMKYLDSAALVISVPSLIAGLWGMNTGGLPGEHTKFGFLMMIIVSLVLALITWRILRSKKYND